MMLFRRQALLLPVEFWARYLLDPNPLRHYRRWKNRRGLDRFIGDIIDERFAARLDGTVQERNSRKLYAVDYAIDVYMEDFGKEIGRRPTTLDAGYRENLITQ